MRSVLVIGFLFAVSAYGSLQPLQLTGEVLIQNNGPRTVIALVQPDERGVSQIFRVTAEDPFPQNPVSLHLANAEVAVRPDRIVIVSRAAKLKVILALNEERPPRELPEELAARQRGLSSLRQETEQSGELNVVVLRGYWLSSRTVEPSRSLSSMKRPAAIAAEWCDASVSGESCLNDDDGSGGGTGSGGGSITCTSGGRGAISCSCSSTGTNCSVTCASGYYACCKDCWAGFPSCTCVKN